MEEIIHWDYWLDVIGMKHKLWISLNWETLSWYSIVLASLGIFSSGEGLYDKCRVLLYFLLLRNSCAICDSSPFFTHTSDITGMGNCVWNLSKCGVRPKSNHFNIKVMAWQFVLVAYFSWDESNVQECVILKLASPVYDCYSVTFGT
jgi:hypothetical protein